MNALLELEDVHAWYGQTKVLHGVNLEVSKGGITALLGANGVGKTTTLRAVCKLMVRFEGDIRFEGETLRRCTTAEVARRGVAHVPDGRGTLMELTVEENLRLGGFCHGSRRIVATEMERAYALFPKLLERRKQQAGTLSGGEQQMLAIGRALMMRPKLMLLDEPSFGLAPLIVKSIFEALRTISENEKVSMLLVEQNANMALSLAQHAYLMQEGRTVLNDTSAAMRGHETVRHVYLGQ
jgi:branched-chain amino acid transport system ATP-binding protein